MSQGLRVLVVDDERISRQTTAQQLRESGHDAEAVENAFLAVQRLDKEHWDVVLTDLRMANMDGLQLLAEINARFPDVDAILMTAYGTVGDAVTAMHQGAVDFLTKPFEFRELEARLIRLAEVRSTRLELSRLKASFQEAGCHCGLVGQSPTMKTVYERIGFFSDNSAPILITGETGTGKEVAASAIHTQSGRSRGPFVPVACGAVPRDLAESEIFGHEKGAFTGAFQRRKGSFERAHKGTLLLDDVDDLPLELQPKLLRALQENRVVRVGGEEEIELDVRVIATTKVSLAEAVQEKRFREDLYYRLCGLEINLPPLRDRGDDIVLLAQHFLKLIAEQEKKSVKTLSPEAADLLRKHPWPGNVRELRRALESAAAVCQVDEILPKHLPDHMRRTEPRPDAFCVYLDGSDEVDFNEVVQQFEGELLRWAMETSGGEQQRAAKLLHLPRTTLQSKLAKNKSSSGDNSR